MESPNDGDGVLLLKRIHTDGSHTHYDAVETESDVDRFETKDWNKARCIDIVRKNLLLILTITAAILGIVVGFAVQTARPSPRAVMLINFPGEILLRLLQMLIMPLIVASLISGIAGLDVGTSGKLGVRAVAYYMTTTLIATILGIILVVTIEPGNRTGDGCIDITESSTTEKLHTLDAFLDLFRSSLADRNSVEATFRVWLSFLFQKHVS